MSDITEDEKRAATDIIEAIYGRWIANHGTPTMETVEILGKMLEEIAACDRKIEILFTTLMCFKPKLPNTFGKWLLRCIKEVAKLSKDHKFEFIGCHNYAHLHYKTALIASLQQ
ncbi:MAG: hypothetical protein AABY83_08790 [Pseudomonadota bacterium]